MRIELGAGFPAKGLMGMYFLLIRLGRKYTGEAKSAMGRNEGELQIAFFAAAFVAIGPCGKLPRQIFSILFDKALARRSSGSLSRAANIR